MDCNGSLCKLEAQQNFTTFIAYLIFSKFYSDRGVAFNLYHSCIQEVNGQSLYRKTFIYVLELWIAKCWVFREEVFKSIIIQWYYGTGLDVFPTNSSLPQAHKYSTTRVSCFRIEEPGARKQEEDVYRTLNDSFLDILISTNHKYIIKKVNVNYLHLLARL